jgi:predicted Fe-Mo cluster-binding NifX family protein
MRIAVLSEGPDLESKVSPVFGRAPYVIIVEVLNGEIKSFESFPNPVSKLGGVGVSLAEELSKYDIQAVVAGNFGTKALNVLKQKGIKIYTTQEITVKEAAIKVESGEIAYL